MAAKLTKAQAEILIEFVSQNAYIYDPRERDHKDAKMIANVWSSVAKALNVPGACRPKAR